MCGWTNLKERSDRGFDWIRHSGPSPLKNTGPKVDHTLGNKEGNIFLAVMCTYIIHITHTRVSSLEDIL